jgi:hypothetical protein
MKVDRRHVKRGERITGFAKMQSSIQPPGSYFVPSLMAQTTGRTSRIPLEGGRGRLLTQLQEAHLGLRYRFIARHCDMSMPMPQYEQYESIAEAKLQSLLSPL